MTADALETRARTLRAMVVRRRDPLTSLVFTAPVFLTYHLGILLLEVRNGVDLFTELTLSLLNRSVFGYVALTLGLAAGFVFAGLWLRGRAKVRPAAFVPILLESLALSLLLLVSVGWLTGQVFANEIGPKPLGAFARVVMSAGAGFHEELVFRAGLFAGGAALLVRIFGVSTMRAVLFAALGSALLFSGVHYVGPLADDFGLVSFTFRFLAGLFLAAVYHFRGFAVAVYTHTFYDLLVFFVI